MCPSARVLILLCAAGGLLAVAPAGRAQPQPDLKPLIERIASGDEDDSAEAAQQLVERVVRPLSEALSGIEARPLEQQRRLLGALGRVLATIRLRLYRGTLPPADLKLFDEFAAKNNELVEELFNDDPRRRLAALHQIPLEPGSGAGVLIVAKVYDWSADVADAALNVAGALKDEVVARGLTRFVNEASDAVRSGQFGPDQQDMIVVLSDFTRRAIGVLGQAGSKDSVPAILAAVRSFGRPPGRQFFALGESLEALGRLQDERAIPVLLEFLDDHEVKLARDTAPGELLQQTVGDAALLALARIYGLSPDKLGFSIDPASGAAGFTSEEARSAALRAFLRWHKQNADKPREQRAALTTQPADEK